MLEVNLRAPVALARALIPGMIDRGAGHLVFISSLQGKAATPAAPLYLATKFGLRGFALGMREDLRGHGIGVSTVFPGFIRDAGMFATSGVRLPPGVGTRSPEDVADACSRGDRRGPGRARRGATAVCAPGRPSPAWRPRWPPTSAGVWARTTIADAIVDTQRSER